MQADGVNTEPIKSPPGPEASGASSTPPRPGTRGRRSGWINRTGTVRHASADLSTTHQVPSLSATKTVPMHPGLPRRNRHELATLDMTVPVWRAAVIWKQSSTRWPPGWLARSRRAPEAGPGHAPRPVRHHDGWIAASTETEARARAALLDVRSYHVFLDLTAGAAGPVRSRTEIRFGCREPGAATFAELTATVTSAVLNGRAVGPAADGRLGLPGLAARMPKTNKSRQIRDRNA